jgi:hypothetical protein
MTGRSHKPVITGGSHKPVITGHRAGDLPPCVRIAMTGSVAGDDRKSKMAGSAEVLGQ